MSISMSRVLRRIFLLPLLLAMLAGCEHSLEIEGKGDLRSWTGENDCSYEEQPCTVTVSGRYVEVYVAFPRDGWRFSAWRGCTSDDHICVVEVEEAVVKAHWGEVAPAIRAIFERIPRLSAYAGKDLSVTEGELAQLQGSVSNDQGSVSALGALNYRWRQVGGRSVTLQNSRTLKPGFVAPEVSSSEQLRFELSVSGPQVETDTDTVVVTVKPRPASNPNGEVVWSQEIGSASNGRIWKVNYRSRDLHGNAVIVSGWIARPNKSRPSAGYPVLAFAHGTTGLADFCAPTRRSSPHATIPLLEDFLSRGMVVAATDYQGLGTSGLHQYLVGPTEARSVLDSVRAARDFAGAGSDVVLFGHSQGGHAVVFANELADSYAPELNVRGTIGSGTGIADSSNQMLEYVKNSAYKGYLLMLARAQRAAYGDAVMPLSNWLTAEGIQAASALDSICVDQLVSTYGPMRADDLFVDGAPLPSKNNNYNPMRDATPGLRVGTSPMLLIHGRYDTQIPPSILVPWVKQTCARGQKIYLKWYSTGHRVPYEAPGSVRPTLTDWIEDRFAGRSAPSSCGSVPWP